MTDTQGTGASALLGNDTPSPASEAQISRAEAYAKRDALMRDPVWREAYMKNDPEKVRQMKEVLAGATRFDLNNMGETIAARETVEREQKLIRSAGSRISRTPLPSKSGSKLRSRGRSSNSRNRSAPSLWRTANL